MVGFVNYAHLGAYMAAQFDSRWVEQNTSSELSLRWKKGNSIAIPNDLNKSCKRKFDGLSI
jgi:hypothetical protein